MHVFWRHDGKQHQRARPCIDIGSGRGRWVQVNRHRASLQHGTNAKRFAMLRENVGIQFLSLRQLLGSGNLTPSLS